MARLCVTLGSAARQQPLNGATAAMTVFNTATVRYTCTKMSRASSYNFIASTYASLPHNSSASSNLMFAACTLEEEKGGRHTHLTSHQGEGAAAAISSSLQAQCRCGCSYYCSIQSFSTADTGVWRESRGQEFYRSYHSDLRPDLIYQGLESHGM